MQVHSACCGGTIDCIVLIVWKRKIYVLIKPSISVVRRVYRFDLDLDFTEIEPVDDGRSNSIYFTARAQSDINVPECSSITPNSCPQGLIRRSTAGARVLRIALRFLSIILSRELFKTHNFPGKFAFPTCSDFLNSIHFSTSPVGQRASPT